MTERNGGRQAEGKAGKPNPWPGIVSLAMLCLTVVAVVWIIWG